MPEVKYRDDHPSTPEARINHRLRNSGGEEADTTVKTGTGPQRVFHNIHNPGSARRHGNVNPGEGDINGRRR
jgi:hypothetical protein